MSRCAICGRRVRPGYGEFLFTFSPKQMPSLEVEVWLCTSARCRRKYNQSEKTTAELLDLDLDLEG